MVAYYWDNSPVIVREIHVQNKGTFTGLYDEFGREIHRKREPFGFDPHRWEQKPKSKKKK